MSSSDPTDSDVLLVGANAATVFPVEVVDRDEYLSALLDGGELLRRLLPNGWKNPGNVAEAVGRSDNRSQ